MGAGTDQGRKHCELRRRYHSSAIVFGRPKALTWRKIQNWLTRNTIRDAFNERACTALSSAMWANTLWRGCRRPCPARSIRKAYHCYLRRLHPVQP